MVEIITERLKVVPMTEDELTVLIDQYKDAVPELSMAYQEMLDNCIKYPEESIWYTSWKICLANNDDEVGYIGFKGFNNGCPEIGYGINDEYTGDGYASEAVSGLCNWAFQMPDVKAIEAETEIDNVKSERVLIKNGFVKTGAIGSEGPRYILRRFK